MEDMRSRIPTVNMAYYVNMRTIEAVHRALDIPLGRGIGAETAAGQGEEVYQHFSVTTDREGGSLHLQTELDYETMRLYQVVVEARDRASLGQANTAQATLIVEVREMMLMSCNNSSSVPSESSWQEVACFLI